MINSAFIGFEDGRVEMLFTEVETLYQFQSHNYQMCNTTNVQSIAS